MNDLEYVILNNSESFGNNGAFGIKIMVAATKLPDLKTDAIWSASHKAVKLISDEIKAAIIAENPETQEEAAKVKQQLLGLFSEKIFHEEIPNGYCADYCCRHSPWYIVTTKIGHFIIGWRKRVINIDWSRTTNQKMSFELFPDEQVTKGNYYIHAWNVSDAKRYLDKILKG